MIKFNFSSYISPFSWRYATPAMKKIWSEGYKYELWRKIWVSLAEVHHETGLVSKDELMDLQKNEKNIDVERIVEIEEETQHDVVAAIREFSEKAKIGGGKIHLGATSMDLVDNTDAIRIKEALEITKHNVTQILSKFSILITKYAETSCIGYTHLQPAEPTTLGYRLAFYAQDFLTDYKLLQFVIKEFRSKGFKGAVGTRASYQEILESTKMSLEDFDKKMCKKLGIEDSLITTQVYPRKYDYLVLSSLASIASSCAKFCADVRLLQSPAIGELSEPFGKKQVGSSAMPFKRNPVNSEKVCSLARFVEQLPAVAIGNASHSYLERTLDDSANKRIILAEGFLALDEMLKNIQKIVTGLVVNEKRIIYNLTQYAPFAATERIIIAAVKKGADRQEMHELMRSLSMKSWEAVQRGETNNFTESLLAGRQLKKYLSVTEIKKLLDISHHTGDAAIRAMKLVSLIKKV